MAVTGQGAHGVFTQSAFGKALGKAIGEVMIGVNANLSASGPGGRGIRAQTPGGLPGLGESTRGRGNEPLSFRT